MFDLLHIACLVIWMALNVRMQCKMFRMSDKLCEAERQIALLNVHVSNIKHQEIVERFKPMDTK